MAGADARLFGLSEAEPGHARAAAPRIEIAAYLGNSDSFDRPTLSLSKPYAIKSSRTTRH